MYEIMYYKPSDAMEVVGVNATDKEIVIEGLSMNTDYVFTIKAYTSKGAGPLEQPPAIQKLFGRCKYSVHALAFVDLGWITHFSGCFLSEKPCLQAVWWCRSMTVASIHSFLVSDSATHTHQRTSQADISDLYQGQLAGTRDLWYRWLPYLL